MFTQDNLSKAVQEEQATNSLRSEHILGQNAENVSSLKLAVEHNLLFADFCVSECL